MHRTATITFLKRLRLALLTGLFFWFFPTLTSQAKAQPVEPVAERPAQPPAGAVGINDPQTGALLLKTAFPGRYVEAPLVAADVSIDVSGPIIRARVTQRFVNVTDQWVEGVYVFPLPADAGVDRLRMMIGDRFIEGEIHERQEARRIYEEARAAGVRASLVEQERPNMFTNSVANIGPGESVVVQIEYQDVARLSDGVFSLRFPMVVGPRYNPEPDMLQVVDLDPRNGFSFNDPVPDRDRISPPVAHPDAEPENGMRLPVSITVDLGAGFPIGAVSSPYHDISVDFGDDRESARVQLADGAVPADRDFALEWRADEGAGPAAAAFTETRADGTYLLAMIAPPTIANAEAPRTPREAIFVIDNSGSMAGKSMPQAKAALILALERLEPEDTFNVVRFDDTYDVVFPTAVPATRENIAHARGYVSGLEADGGTEMLPALRAALSDPNPGDASRVRQVVFLTDGAIGNEAQLFEAIDAGLGRSRLFTVGIGSAPNTYFMSRAARIGRGTFTHIGDIDEVQERADALFTALERPVMTNLTAEFPDGTASEVWPNPLPDLYAGEPVVLTARLDEPVGTVRVSGTFEGRRWAADLDIADAAPGEGVAVLWARAKIASIEEQRFMGAAPETIDRAVLQTALEYGLVSRLTSLVAVDVEPARPANARLTRTDVPTMLPDGWEFDKVFGPEIDAFIREAAVDGDLIEILNDANPAAAPQTQAQADGIALPRGGTTANIQIVLGLMLMLLGAAAWTRARAVRARK